VKKYFIAGLLIGLVFVFSGRAEAAGAAAYGVYDCLSGKMLQGKNTEEKMSVASTTKLMTALVAVEKLPPDRVIEVKKEDTGIEGSSVCLKAGERLTVRTLLYGLLLESGNDAATVLARAAAGTVGDFAKAMNRKAEELGMSGSYFVNPSGLEEEGHGSTVKDLCLLMNAVLENDELLTVIGTESITLEGRYFHNHNKLLEKSDACIGGKTGYTRSAGRCLVSAFEAESRRVIIVTLKDPDDWEDHLALYRDYESSLKKTRLCVYCSLPLAGGPYRAIVLKSEFEVRLLPGEAVKASLIAPHFLFGMPLFGEAIARIGIDIGKSRLETKTAVVCGVRY